MSYYITFFQTLPKTAFSCGLCYSDKGIVLSYREKRKVNYFFQEQKGDYITILSTNNKSVRLQIFTLRGKTSIILHYFARKTKVSYYITFFQTLLKTFSCGLCYSDRRIILSYCEKRKVIMFARRTIYSFQRTTKVSCYKYLHCRWKTKVSYYIFCEKNKSIVLHHVLPNSPENVFLRPFLFW